jgi:hypothetical protein
MMRYSFSACGVQQALEQDHVTSVHEAASNPSVICAGMIDRMTCERPDDVFERERTQRFKMSAVQVVERGHSITALALAPLRLFDQRRIAPAIANATADERTCRLIDHGDASVSGAKLPLPRHAAAS